MLGSYTSEIPMLEEIGKPTYVQQIKNDLNEMNLKRN